MEREDLLFVDQRRDSNLTPDELRCAFGRRLFLARIAEGYPTCASLADAIGVDYGTIARWELGRNYPCVPDLLRITRLLSVTIDWLYAGDPKHLDPDVFRRIRSTAESIR